MKDVSCKILSDVTGSKQTQEKYQKWKLTKSNK